ncbi:hypothetical protein EW146_g7516 [Bondarzewia mesenterica]|uniref:Elongator complex protein 2 n=1 Tax=Bondarzewia mesenterica TaxID=1095465 RepID=A0A4V3XE82_9AGAM|nr:hypothetical protein EW146_g7516 [Bondarzewia mesenterica]
MAQASFQYISASVNRFNHAASSSLSSLVAYGSGRFIALWDTEDTADRGVLSTLVGHSSIVTCVKFIDDRRFVSADDAGALRIWERGGDGKAWLLLVYILSTHTEMTSLQAHSKGVSALGVHVEAACIVTGASDSTVKIWSFGAGGAFNEVQSISLKGRYPLSLELASLPQSKALILAIAGTDKNIQIYTRSEELFVSSATLPGHEDWVRSLSFRPSSSPSEPLVLASGSQDATIRLWNVEPVKKVEPQVRSATDVLSDELLDAFEASLGELTDAEEGGRQISLKKHVLTVKNGNTSSQQFSITFDALLIGHEAGITTLTWRPSHGLPSSATPSPESTSTLLSTSTDSSLILWSPSPILTSQPGASAAIWVNRQRFGDVGGQRLGGFVGGLWLCNGRDALAWGWAGGCRRWHCEEFAREEGGLERWREVGAISGHAGPVRGIAWSPGGEYLISSGVDQMTRIHGAIPTAGHNGQQVHSWHELGRPQVHGYDIVGVASLDVMRFASVADEKVARVFEAPRAFVHTVKTLGVADLAVNEEERPAAASVPPLGLSNKAVNDIPSLSADSKGPTRRPFEGELTSMTLWPEVEKVFGHGYESITIGVSTSRTLMATACKATTPKHAVVRIFDTEKFQPVGEPLEGHALTVTRIAFSPDDREVLTVSRDRTWRLFRAKAEGGYVPVAADKSHTRIIWDCAWAPRGDAFATASRDKTVKIWHPKGETRNQWASATTLKLQDAATALAFTPDNKEKQILAIGLETGEFVIYRSSQPDDWIVSLCIKPGIAHLDHIYQLAWRPEEHTEQKHLASCSEDGTLRILKIQFEMN